MKTHLLCRSAALALLAVLSLSQRTLNGQNWIVTSAPSEDWVSVACSADGATLVAVAITYPNGGPIMVSTNSGTNWTAGTLSGNPSAWRTNWNWVACSADGTRMVAANTLIYTSTNSGISWAPTTAPFTNWTTVASSADGNTLYGAVGFPGGDVYISTNFGASWSSTSPPNGGRDAWSAISCSADGAVVVAASSFHRFGDYQSGLVNVSTDQGATWTVANLPGERWASVAASADGKRLCAAAAGIPRGSPVTYIEPRALYLSSDFGASWSPAPDLFNWQSVACSADGAAVIAVGTSVYPMPNSAVIYTTSDGGSSWDLDIEPGLTGSQAVASSADGAKIVRVKGNQILTWNKAVVSPHLSILLSDEQVILSWLIPSTRFALQQTPSLAHPAWTDVATQPGWNYKNLNQEVSLPTQAGPVFFRLVSR